MIPTQIGTYEIIRLLGTGAFASVWLAHDVTLRADVAIKVLADNWAHDLDVRERFLEEARILWRADSERIVRVHAVDALPDSRPYFVMAFADAGSLEDRIRAGRMANAAIAEVVRIGIDIADGLDVLHRLGVIHRDVKPSNVLFRRRGDCEQLMLADLGLAKSLAHASGYTITTGTPAYMAPEQSVPAGGMDERVDVYALGVVLRQLLEGREDGPEQLSDVVRRACDPDRDGRQPSARALGDELRALLVDDVAAPAGTVSAALSASGSEPGKRPDAPQVGASSPDSAQPDAAGRTTRRRRGRVVAPVAAVVALLGGVAAVVSRGSESSVRRQDTTRTLQVRAPRSWGHVAGGGWQLRDFPGAPASIVAERGFGLSVAPDARYSSDPTVPGIFVGASRELADRSTPDEVLAGVVHATCTRGTLQDQVVDGMVGKRVRWTGCGESGVSFTEAAVEDEGEVLVYIQVKESSAEDRARTSSLLNSVRVRRPLPSGQ